MNHLIIYSAPHHKYIVFWFLKFVLTEVRIPGGPGSEDDEDLLVGQIEGQRQPSQCEEGGGGGGGEAGDLQLSRHSVQTNQKQPLSKPSVVTKIRLKRIYYSW